MALLELACWTQWAAALLVAVVLARFLLHQRRARSTTTATSAASATPAVRPSRYAAISSVDTNQAGSQSAAFVAPQPVEVELDPAEQAEYDAARLQTRIECTLVKAYKTAATALKQGRAQAPGTDLANSDAATLAQALPHYDAFDSRLPSLRHFTHVRKHTHCIFAKHSKVWGSPRLAAGPPPSVEAQTLAALPGLVDFALRVKAGYPRLRELPESETAPSLDINDATSFFTADTKRLLEWPTKLADFSLDAFVVEITGAEHGASIEAFARTVRAVLATLSRCDPVMASDSPHDHDSFGVDITTAQSMAAMDSPTANEAFSSARWHYNFLQEPFFVTCFAPCYPSNHARYMFAAESGEDAEAMSQRCFVLFQPELSFLRHNLSADTKDTNWNAPKTERDRIRVAFKQNSRAYPIPPSVAYPSAHMIVPPLEPFSGQVIRWWERAEA